MIEVVSTTEKLVFSPDKKVGEVRKPPLGIPEALASFFHAIFKMKTINLTLFVEE